MLVTTAICLPPSDLIPRLQTLAAVGERGRERVRKDAGSRMNECVCACVAVISLSLGSGASLFPNIFRCTQSCLSEIEIPTYASLPQARPAGAVSLSQDHRKEGRELERESVEGARAIGETASK